LYYVAGGRARGIQACLHTSARSDKAMRREAFSSEHYITQMTARPFYNIAAEHYAKMGGCYSVPIPAFTPYSLKKSGIAYSCSAPRLTARIPFQWTAEQE
jgi:hypothetical protein